MFTSEEIALFVQTANMIQLVIVGGICCLVFWALYKFFNMFF